MWRVTAGRLIAALTAGPLFVGLFLFQSPPEQAELGQSRVVEIRMPFAGSDIVVRASARVAGAVDGLTWQGQEFINNYDHGRELQSASSFNGWGECFNPTEAGSRDDGTGPTSTSRLLSIKVVNRQLITRTRMAFWLSPGEHERSCRGITAVNKTVLSDHELQKVVTVGARGLPNVIEHRVTFRVPESYTQGSFEALTAYMPPSFSRFWAYDPLPDQLMPLSDGPGTQRLPVILATPDGRYALGVYSPGLPQPKRPHSGYGRWRFADLWGPGNATVKWNCSFRERPVAAGDHTFTCYSIIGTLASVRQSMHQLAEMLPRSARP